MKKFLELAAVLALCTPVGYCYIGGMYGVKVPSLVQNQTTGILAFDNVVALTTSGIIIFLVLLAIAAAVLISCAIPEVVSTIVKKAVEKDRK